MPIPMPPVVPAVLLRRQVATAVKAAVIGALILLLLIPLAMIRGVLSERQHRRREAVEDITSVWGRRQSLVGPILTVPYRYSFQTWKEQVVNGRSQQTRVTETAVATAHFLPVTLFFRGRLEPSVLHRGIYEAVVYGGQLEISGEFAPPEFDAWKVDPEDVLWEDARVSLGVTDLRGTRAALTMQLGESAVPLTPGTRIAAFPAGVQGDAGEAVRDGESLPFSMSLDIKGSGGILFAPLGRQTEVRLASPWPDPKFGGAFLPAEREVAAEGFEATWQVSYYGRSYPQQWSNRDEQASSSLQAIQTSLFGVDLIQAVDSYRFVQRSIKYGILFIVLIFAAFFLFEALSPVRIHPFQYLLVGFALCLFYLALLSLSEFVSFGLAYLVGAGAATAMIVLYSAKVLHGGKRASMVAAQLAATYLFLFVILRQQDYALLLGTAGLFVVLAAVMYLTRNIDWYARDAGEAGN